MSRGTVGLVLAAGAGSRFGGGKLLAPIGGRPILQHVLDALAATGLEDVVVVLGADAAAVEAAIDWRAERRVVNPEPGRGLSSSLAVGFETIGPDADAVLVALGDQPLVSVEAIRSLLDVPIEAERSIVVPAYADERGRNPVLVRRAAFGTVAEAAGDRGLGPVIAAHPELVAEIPVPGTNPDVDTPDDHARAIEAAWATRVRANRDQVERIREVPDGTDFYAPVNSFFRADPTRTDDTVLNALLRLLRSGDTWLDVGAGAGRFALPIARALDRSGGAVVALDASPSMLESLLRDRRGLRHREPAHGRSALAAGRSRAGGGVRGGRRAHRPRRLRRRSDRSLHRRARGGGRPSVRRGPDGARPGIGGGRVLATGPR